MSEDLSGAVSAQNQTNCECDEYGTPTGEVDREALLSFWGRKLALRPADLELFLRHGFTLETVPKINDFNRRNMLAYLKKKDVTPPMWMVITGMWPEVAFDEGERRKRLRVLYKALVLLIKRSLGRAAADPFKAERSVFWEPKAEVCRALEIAPSKLSEFCKEFAGHSLSQVIDCVKAEKVRGKMKAGVRAFVRGQVEGGRLRVDGGGSQGACLGMGGVDLDALKEALKAARREEGFSRNAWAMGLGFGSYRKMYRACLAVYGMTPLQMEVEMVKEVLGEDGDGGVVEAWDLNAIEEAIRGIGAYERDRFAEGEAVRRDAGAPS